MLMKSNAVRTWKLAAAAVAAAMLLAACGAPAAPASAPAQQAPAAQGAAQAGGKAADLASLPRDVDVQTAASLKERPDVVILDVREQNEWDAGHIPGAVLIPVGQVQSRIKEIPTDKTVIVQCHSGNRSSKVTDFLRGQGMTNVHNMVGGIAAWEKAGLPVTQ